MEASKFWKILNTGSLSFENLKENLPKFRSSKVNFHLTLHDPEEYGMRYLETTIFLMVENMTDGMYAKLRRIKNRNFGYPISILWKGDGVDLDYAQAVYELDFMERHFDFDGKDVLEIGAGYGRTCHTILSNHDVKSYTIADLDNCLALTHKYLSEVLTEEQFGKIKFVPVERESLNSDFDLCVCLDVFAELDEGQAEQYIKYIDTHCRYFYLRAPLQQYNVEVYDVKCLKTIQISLNTEFEEFSNADDEHIKRQVPKFLEIYRPGPDWECLDDSNSKPYMEYWQAIWKK